MFDSDVDFLLQQVEQILSLSIPFRIAVEAGRIPEAKRISKEASKSIATLAVGIRNLQDKGRCPKVTRTIGIWIKDASETRCSAAISEKKITSGEPLHLREVSNKFVHVKNSTFRFDPNHRMVLVGELSGKLWIVDFAIEDFCFAARDALYETEPAS